MWSQGDEQVSRFTLAATSRPKSKVTAKEVQSGGLQLGVCIHRVRRPFEVTQRQPVRAGDSTDEGLEVLVGGKGEGDKYRIKDDVVTMVTPHIHGTVVTIHTEEVTDTGGGYLSKRYSSQYAIQPAAKPRWMNHFIDTCALGAGGGQVLSERVIRTEAWR